MDDEPSGPRKNAIFEFLVLGTTGLDNSPCVSRIHNRYQTLNSSGALGETYFESTSTNYIAVWSVLGFWYRERFPWCVILYVPILPNGTVDPVPAKTASISGVRVMMPVYSNARSYMSV